MRAPDRIDIARRALAQALAHPFTWAPFVPIAGAYAFIGAPWWVCLPTAVAVGSGVGAAWTKRWRELTRRVRVEAMTEYRQQETEGFNRRIAALASHEARFVAGLREAVLIKCAVENRLLGDGLLTEHEEEVGRTIADLVRSMIESAERLPPTLGPEFQAAAARFDNAAQMLRAANAELDVILDPLPESLRTVPQADPLSQASDRLSEQIERARGVRRFLEQRLPADPLSSKVAEAKRTPLPEG